MNWFLGAVLIFTASSAFARDSIEDVNGWTSDVAVPKMKIRKQNWGNCWAHAYVALLENRSIKLQRPVTLSARYLTQRLVLTRIHDGETLTEQSGGNVFAAILVMHADGIAIDGLETPLEPLPDSAAESHPTLQKQFFDWLSSRLPYETPNDDQIEDELNRLNGSIAARPNTPFLFANWKRKKRDEMVQYTPRTFSDRYLRFNSDEIGGIMKRGLNRSEVQNEAEIIAKRLKNGIGTMLGFTLMGADEVQFDREVARTGIVNRRFIDEPGAKSLGDHDVFVVNVLRDENKKVAAFVTQNSWGLVGRDQNGKDGAKAEDLGYTVVTLDYLAAIPPEKRLFITSFYQRSHTIPSTDR